MEKDRPLDGRKNNKKIKKQPNGASHTKKNIFKTLKLFEIKIAF